MKTAPMKIGPSTSVSRGEIAPLSSSSCCGTKGDCAPSCPAPPDATPTIWRRKPLSARGSARANIGGREVTRHGSWGSAGACSSTSGVPRGGVRDWQRERRLRLRPIRAPQATPRSTPADCLAPCRRRSALRSPYVSVMAGRMARRLRSWGFPWGRSNRSSCAGGQRRRR